MTKYITSSLLFISFLILFFLYSFPNIVDCNSCSPLKKNDYTLETYNINKDNKWATFRDENNGVFFIHPGDKNATTGVFTFKKDTNFILIFSIRSGSKVGDIKFSIKKNKHRVNDIISTAGTIQYVFITVQKNDNLTIIGDKHGSTAADWGNLKIQIQNNSTKFTLSQYKHALYLFAHKYFDIILFILILITLVAYRDYNLTYRLSNIRNKSNIILNDLLLLYAFFTPISMEMGKHFLNLMLIFWLMDKDILSKLKKMINNRVIQSILLFLLLLILSLLWTDPQNIKTGTRYLKYYSYLLPLFIIYTSVRKEYIHYIISAFLMSMVLSEVISYGIFFDLLNTTMIPFTRDDATSMNPSAFLHHTTYSMFLVVTAGILLDRFFLSQEIKYKLIYGLFFIMVTTNLFVNAGRTGQVAYFITILIVILLHYKICIKMFFTTSVLFVSIVFLAFTFSPVFKQRLDQTIQSLSQPDNYYTAIGSRIGMTIIAVNIVKEHPLTGVGIGNYRQAKSDMIDSRFPKMKSLKPLVHYHNQYLEFLVIMGIFGLAVYLSIYLFLVRTPIKDEEIRSIKYIVITTIMISSLTDAMFHLRSPLSLFALFAGIILAQSYFEAKESKSDT